MSKIAATVKVLILSAFVALGAASAFAETETVNGYTWTYRINGDTVLKFGETPQWRYGFWQENRLFCAVSRLVRLRRDEGLRV